jgi:hypothetical protein
MQTRRSGKLSLALALLGLVVFAAQGLYAQVDTGGITGTVKDASGAVIPGAKVSLTNEGTSYSVSTVTDSAGTYTFTPVKIGSYKVTAEFQGFQTSVHPGVTVNVQQQVVVDFALQPGQVTQTVEVTAAVPLLQTQNGSVGQVVSSKEVNDLPLATRNFTFLAQLSAGVLPSQADTRGNAASGAFTANGNRSAQNNYLLDGIDDNADLVDFLNGTNYVVLPPPDAIGEFKVQTNNYSAEFGRAGGAVLNATIKSGTNQIHGTAWEFFGNNSLDARDFFSPNTGELRYNQFGGSVGGPIVIPHVINGKNKLFFFGDYQGTRQRQSIPYTKAGVPTALEAGSGYTNMSDILGTSANQTDPEGRLFLGGTVFDPPTTRGLPCTSTDSVTGLKVTGANGGGTCTAGSTVYVRDPIFATPQSISGVTNFTTAAWTPLLNQLPASRLDPNAIKLLQLYPAANNGAQFGANFNSTPVSSTTGNSFDIRIDANISDKDQFFGRFSYVNFPEFLPGVFGGIADGGGFQVGDQTANSTNLAGSYTHSFSPTLINEARIGFNRIGTSRLQANGNTLGIPAQYGIQDIPQVPLNGGLPTFGIQGLNNLGSSAFLVSVEYNSTVQLTENLTKIHNQHTFKGGFEWQHIKFSTLQPPWSRGEWNFDGNYTNIPGGNETNLGEPQFLLTPTASTVGGLNGVGGSDNVYASNIANTDNGRNYYGLYFQDDWKVTPKLTLNLGLRWDYFGQVVENFGAQANFVPAPVGQAQYLIPSNSPPSRDPLSTSFIDTLKTDNIALVYLSNQTLGQSQKSNFAPRFGFAYQVNPKLVVRGGYGLFYGGFENRGFSPNIGENYPFQFSFNFTNGSNGTSNPVAGQPPGAANSYGPITYLNANGTVCGTATIEGGFSCIPLTATNVLASGLQLRGIQYNYITPYTQNINFFVQYQWTPNTSVTVGYAGNFTRHLEVFPGSNEVSQLLPSGTSTKNYVPWPDFGTGASYAATEGSSYYNSLQLTIERRFSQVSGLQFLAGYTYSKNRGDAHDLLNGGGDTGGPNSNGSYRAPYLPNFGIQGDYGLVNFDIRNNFVLSGSYELPFGKGKHWGSSATGVENALIGGWSTNWILTLQDGQPQTIPCVSATSAGFGCYALLTGKSVTAGPHNVNQWYNPAAFAQPVATATIGETNYAPLGGAATQATGPGFHNLDLSFFKEFKTSENTHLQFRAQFFNFSNTPNFNQPGFGGNGVTAIGGSTNFQSSTFGEIGSTRNTPNDARRIQFALKFFF